MDKVREDAVNRHGKWLYTITWRARETEAKYLWFVVALVSFFEMFVTTLPSAVLFVFFYGLTFKYLVMLCIMAFLMVTFVDPIFNRKITLTTISSLYSVAADVKRQQLGVLYKFLFVFCAGIALYLAVVTYFLYRGRMHKLRSTDLDVLGSVLSKAGLWNMVRPIYNTIGMRYADRKNIYDGHYDRELQIAVSYALATKWMIPEDTSLVGSRKAIIREIMSMYPTMPERVVVRLQEGLSL